MSVRKLLVGLAAATTAIVWCAASAQAQILTQAFVPESGFYWNPDQPGRGYAIETQDRQVFLTIYTYTEETNPAQREPLWFSALGTLVPTVTGPVSYSFNDELVFSEDGQCLGCTFQDPVSTFTGRPLSLTFTGATTGELLIDGELIPIQRFWYSPSIDDPFLAMLGQWAFVTDCTAPINNSCFPSDANVQPFEGDLLTVDVIQGVGVNSTSEGFRAGTDIAVAGSYNAVDNVFVIVVAETNEEYLAYVIFGENFGTDVMVGIAERYPPGQNFILTGDGFPTVGQRISDRTFAETLDPALKNADTPSRESVMSRSQINRALADRKTGIPSATKSARLASVTPMLRALEQRLKAQSAQIGVREK